MNRLVAAVVVTVICVMHCFLSFFLRNIFPERAAHSKGAMIVSLFFTVGTLPNAGGMLEVCEKGVEVV